MRKLSDISKQKYHNSPKKAKKQSIKTLIIRFIYCNETRKYWNLTENRVKLKK